METAQKATPTSKWDSFLQLDDSVMKGKVGTHEKIPGMRLLCNKLKHIPDRNRKNPFTNTEFKSL